MLCFILYVLYIIYLYTHSYIYIFISIYIVLSIFYRKLHRELTFDDPKGFLCVYVGRISKEKRIETIFEAISSLDNVYLALIGDGPTANQWAELHSKSNKLYCKPKFLSHEDLAEIYASSDLHVSASEFETLGNTVLEAQASNIAVVVPETQVCLYEFCHYTGGYIFIYAI